MLYLNVQDFFDKTADLTILSREDERKLFLEWVHGDTTARSRIIEGYLPMVAGHIRHCKQPLQTLNLVYGCLQALEHAVDSFDFLQDSEPFSHRLSWYLRQATVRCIVDQRNATSHCDV